jgi:hypothetical protein
MSRDGRYAAGARMRRSGHVQGWTVCRGRKDAQERPCPGMDGSLFDILSARHSYVLYIICRGRKDAQEQLPRSNFLLVRTRLESSEIDSGFKWRGK